MLARTRHSSRSRNPRSATRERRAPRRSGGIVRNVARALYLSDARLRSRLAACSLSPDGLRRADIELDGPELRRRDARRAQREALQEETMRLDDRIAALRSDDRLAALAARLGMRDPQRFAVVRIEPPHCRASPSPSRCSRRSPDSSCRRCAARSR